jgi:aminoglycoside phosphotransferase (APT) family kinase protein
MQVSLRTPEKRVQCVIKTADRIVTIEREARVLEALAEVGLPVPTVLAGPVPLSEHPDMRAAMLLSELSGQSLPWLGLNSLSDADLTCRLVIQGVLRLHELTETIGRHGVTASLPRITLSAELDEIVQRGGEWLRVDLFARAVDYLHRTVRDAEVPLAFSNGDYNPLNFLSDGSTVTGWVDFEGACFEDPHIGFAKFLIWSRDDFGWGTGIKAGLVERYLYAQNVSRREFAPRLVLRCLHHLIREVSPREEADAALRGHMLGLLEEGLADLGG